MRRIDLPFYPKNIELVDPGCGVKTCEAIGEAEINIAVDGVRLVNFGAYVVTDDVLPSEVLIGRSFTDHVQTSEPTAFTVAGESMDVEQQSEAPFSEMDVDLENHLEDEKAFAEVASSVLPVCETETVFKAGTEVIELQ